MKTKYIYLVIGLILITLPIIILGQGQTPASTNTGDANKLLQFLKGDGAFEGWFVQGFAEFEKEVNKETADIVLIGKSIAGLGAILSLGYFGWQVISGDREWEITPIVKTVLIGLIVVNWTASYNIIKAPFNGFTKNVKAKFEQIEKESNQLRVQRFQKQNQLLDYLVSKATENQVEEEQRNENKSKWEQLKESISDGLEEGWKSLRNPIIEWSIRMEFKIQKIVGDLIEAVGLMILRVCVYFILFIQKLWSSILIITGPIAVGMALIPGFENSLTNWIAKFININLYTFVAFQAINLGQILIQTGYKMEIERYSIMLDDKGKIIDEGTMMAFMSGNGLIYIGLMTFVAYTVTGIGVLMTPTITDSIVSAGGSSIMSKMKQSAGKIASGGKVAGQGMIASGKAGIQIGKEMLNKFRN